jgi:hypothetical protein
MWIIDNLNVTFQGRRLTFSDYAQKVKGDFFIGIKTLTAVLNSNESIELYKLAKRKLTKINKI